MKLQKLAKKTINLRLVYDIGHKNGLSRVLDSHDMAILIGKTFKRAIRRFRKRNSVSKIVVDGESRELGVKYKLQPNPVKFSIAEVFDRYGQLDEEQLKKETPVIVSGKISMIRKLGQSSFAMLEDNTAIIQTFFNVGTQYNGHLVFEGQSITIVGSLFRTKGNELTISVMDVIL